MPWVVRELFPSVTIVPASEATNRRSTFNLVVRGGAHQSAMLPAHGIQGTIGFRERGFYWGAWRVHRASRRKSARRRIGISGKAAGHVMSVGQPARRQDDEEFVSAQTNYIVTCTCVTLKKMSHGDEHFVAPLMAERVVNGFELVQVQCHARPNSRAASTLEMLGEKTPVVTSG